MLPRRADSSVFENENLIRVHDRSKLMRNDDNRFPTNNLADRFRDFP